MAISKEANKELIKQAELELCRRDLPTYVKRVFGYPTYPHMKIWADALMDESRQNLLLIAPPGHAKSSWVSIFYSSWLIGRSHAPDSKYPCHIIFLSNTAEQADRPSIAVRDTILSSAYREVFPWVEPDPSKGWGQSEWFIKRRNVSDPHATFLATGTPGPILGARCSDLILDDVNDEENTANDLQRMKIRNFVMKTAMSRREPDMHGKFRVIDIQTRWHEEDLACEFINDPAWKVIHMPALGYWGAETDSNGKVVLDLADKPKLKPLCSEIINYEALLAIKNKPGNALIWEGMYQGNPVVPEGSIIKNAWWKMVRYRDYPMLTEYEFLLMAMDTAYKTKESNDYTVCLVMGLYKGNIYIINCFRQKIEWPDLQRMSKELYVQYKPRVVLIEDRASGQTLIQALLASSQPVMPVVPVKADVDKVTRINAISGIIQAGRVVLPGARQSDGVIVGDLDWVESFVHEVGGFPKASHDDQADALAHGLNYLTLGDSFSHLDNAIMTGTLRYLPDGDVHIGDWDALPGRSAFSDFLREMN